MNILEFLNGINSASTTNFKISKNPGLKISELHEFEKKFSISLPQDLVEFYTVSNGVSGDDFIFNILPFSKIEKDKDDLGVYIVFSEYLIFSETCGLEIDKTDSNKYRIFNTSISTLENGIITRKYVADSLIDFLKLYSIKGTFGIWGDETEHTDDDNEEKYVAQSNKSVEFVISETKKPWWKFW